MEKHAITKQQMIEVDRLMVEKYHISLTQMMENAGRNLAELGRVLLDGDVRGKNIAVICGNGNNGGGGMVAARHLHNWGANVVFHHVGDPSHLREVPAHQLRILAAMSIHSDPTPRLEDADLIIDALIGYSLRGSPRQPAAGWIEQINLSSQPVLALDVPSGLDATSGKPGNPCVRASATLTLALPKTGLFTDQARPFTGDLYLADIGVPPALYSEPILQLAVGPIFNQETIILLESGWNHPEGMR